MCSMENKLTKQGKKTIKTVIILYFKDNNLKKKKKGTRDLVQNLPSFPPNLG